MEQVANLWPEYIGNIEISAPVQILAKQAEYFNGMMQNVLVATVDPHIAQESTLEGETVLVNELRIRVPSLGNYSLTVLRMKHSAIKPYPVSIYNAITDKKVEREITEEKELVSALKNIFSSKELNEAISAILSQVKHYSHSESGFPPF